MSYYLFLDDERIPRNVKWIHLPLVDWRIVRTYEDFVETITRDGLPRHISFDHDLVDEHYKEYFRVAADKVGVPTGVTDIRYDQLKEKTGYEAAKWLVEYCLEHDKDLPEYTIHTMNPFGRLNIESILESYKKHRTNERSK